MQANVLSQLKDIQTPEPIGWWPLAWGWYVVLVVVLIAIVFAIKWAINYRKQRIVKNAALKAMQSIENEPLPLTTVRQINDVLKRALLGYAPRADIANVTGEAWANLLNALAPANAQINPNLLELAYQPKCSAKDANDYFDQANEWLQKTLPVSETDIANALNKESGHV